MQSVRLSALKVSNLRNYTDLSLSFDRTLIVLTGPNGAGKTNLLEAISLFSPGRGLRRSNYEAIALRGSATG